jgi:hypothetical protein
MARATQLGLDGVYEAVFRRYCELAGNASDDPSDPLVRDLYETLAAYEQLLTEKNGRSTRAKRTRDKIMNKGVFQSLLEWARGKTETEGFKLLVERGLPEFTSEYLVVKHAARFPEDAVNRAHGRLTRSGIELPSLSQST